MIVVALAASVFIPNVAPQALFTALAISALASGASSILEVVYPNELFPTEIRATAVGFGTAISRVGSAASTYLMPVAIIRFGASGALLIGAGISLIGLVATFILAPETANRSLSDAAGDSSNKQQNPKTTTEAAHPVRNPRMSKHQPIGPAEATKVPRFAGLGTFARLPQIDAVPDYDIAVLGVPFDGGTSFRPGARFGPAAVREASRLLRPGYHVELDATPVEAVQVVGAGDVACTPYDIGKAVQQIEEQALPLMAKDKRVIAVGGPVHQPVGGFGPAGEPAAPETVAPPAAFDARPMLEVHDEEWVKPEIPYRPEPSRHQRPAQPNAQRAGQRTGQRRNRPEWSGGRNVDNSRRSFYQTPAVSVQTSPTPSPAHMKSRVL
ncbi:MFS transporter [Arthrobacter sp. KK5.5]|uniref:MFS transporter n=1 Tax=Arthrobacter sp. KK5.5 TaxID=3373084 RepID=UPI003EE50656